MDIKFLDELDKEEIDKEIDSLKKSGVESNQILVDALNSKEVQASTSDTIKINVNKVKDIKVGDYSVGDVISRENLKPIFKETWSNRPNRVGAGIGNIQSFEKDFSPVIIAVTDRYIITYNQYSYSPKNEKWHYYDHNWNLIKTYPNDGNRPNTGTFFNDDLFIYGHSSGSARGIEIRRTNDNSLLGSLDVDPMSMVVIPNKTSYIFVMMSPYKITCKELGSNEYLWEVSKSTGYPSIFVEKDKVYIFPDGVDQNIKIFDLKTGRLIEEKAYDTTKWQVKGDNEYLRISPLIFEDGNLILAYRDRENPYGAEGTRYRTTILKINLNTGVAIWVNKLKPYTSGYAVYSHTVAINEDYKDGVYIIEDISESHEYKYIRYLDTQSGAIQWTTPNLTERRLGFRKGKVGSKGHLCYQPDFVLYDNTDLVVLGNIKEIGYEVINNG